MSTYPRVALFIFFDAVERDITDQIRALPIADDVIVLSLDEVSKASSRLERREGVSVDPADHLSLLPGLDLGEKYAVLMRHRNLLNLSAKNYYESKLAIFETSIPVRNAVMHGRPLTTTEFSLGISVANELVSAPDYWPNLASALRKYDSDPERFYQSSISILDDDTSGGTLHNLPSPDYEDTGFFPRPDLEKDLIRKILGRYPVITVLGDGGNGKTALTLQTLYGLISSNDHPFDAFVWVSAKANRLSVKEIERIEGAITTSLGLLTEVADQFEPGSEPPFTRVKRLMEDNRVLLVIDNLETVLDQTLRDLAADIPGDSKLVFTSRVPLGSDLSVHVGDFNEKEARGYLRRVIEAYDIKELEKKNNEQIDRYAARLSRKPLLLKWFALGVAKGLDPDAITKNPDMAFKFCMENVIDRLDEESKVVASALAAVSSSLSAPLIEELTSLSPVNVERCLAELLQFGLVQREDKVKTERVYSLRGFARSYITKVLKISPEFSSDVAKKLRAVEAVFQIERGGVAFNRYDSRAFTVRNRTEALAARKLKDAMISASKGEIVSAESALDALRVSSSDYFEFHRVDALVARKAGDLPRAMDAYDSALEIAENQPQLHVFYAGLLSRDMADFPAAAAHLDRALELDPDVPYVLQEAARNAFFSYDFSKAKSLLDRAARHPAKTRRDAIIFADLNSQLHYREADYLTRSGDVDGAGAALEALIGHLASTPLNHIDEKHREHLRKCHRLISELRRTGDQSLDIVLDALVNQLRSIEAEAVSWPAGDADSPDADNLDGNKGRLREPGRTETFGFLRNRNGDDSFVSRAAVGERVWSRLCAGVSASYDVVIGPKGKPQAINVLVDG